MSELRLFWNGYEMSGDTGFLEMQVEGVEDSPEIDDNSVNHTHRHGERVGSMLSGARRITCEFELIPDGGTGSLRRSLVQATPIGVTGELVVRKDNEDVLFYGRVMRRTLGMDVDYQDVVKGAVQWKCDDPRAYSLAEHSLTTGVAVATGAGLPYDQKYPAVYVDRAGNGTIKVENSGNADAQPVYVLKGLLQQPVITLSDSEGVRQARVLGNIGKFGEMVIDVFEGSVKLDGTERLSMIRSVLVHDMYLSPGVTEVSLEGVGDGSLTVKWRDASI